MSYISMESDIESKGASYPGHQFNHRCQLMWEFWLAGLLTILSTVLTTHYPSGSPSDCYYKCSCVSNSVASESDCYLPLTDSQKRPAGTFDAHLLPISITLLPSGLCRLSLWLQCFLLPCSPYPTLLFFYPSRVLKRTSAMWVAW